MCLTGIDLTNEAVIYLNLPCVRILVQLASFFPKRPVCLDVPILGYKLLLMGFHIGKDPLYIAQHQFFQNAFADIVGGADLASPDTVAVPAAGVSVLALQCARALLRWFLFSGSMM